MIVAVVKELQEEDAPKVKTTRQKKPETPKDAEAQQRARAHIFVGGHVQGVFYRAYVKEAASTHGITGWVRNVADGRVEIIAEGVKAQLEEFVKKLRGGPVSARPGDIQVEWLPATHEFSDFEVRRDWGQ